MAALLVAARRHASRVLAPRACAPALNTARFYSAGEEQDVVIIGGGPGGYVAAIKAAQLGMKVTCVEGRGALGGTCLNVGCIPSKALLQSSHMFYDAKKNFAAHGVEVADVKVNLDAMMKQKSDAMAGLTGGIEGLFKKNGVTYSKGWGKITGPNSVEVALNDGGSETLNAKNIMIATGSDVAQLKGVPIDEERIVSSTGALSLKEVPTDMVVIGGGVIGLEMGSVWSRLGANVTVVEFTDGLIPGTDSDIKKAFERSLKKQGLKFKMKTAVQGAEVVGDKVKLTMAPAKGGDSTEMLVDVCLVATGRVPYTNNLGLESVGIETNARGQIEVDSEFRTKVPSIRAIGDVIPGPMLAHKAEEDGVACVEFLAGLAGHVDYNHVPGIIYTHPEVASVGMTEEAAKAAGIKYKTGKFSLMANSRARAVGDAEGLVKFVACAETDKILGAHIMGNNAGELIHECCLAMTYGGSTEDIARVCHGHPTLSEAVKEAAMATYDKPIHM